MCIDCRLWSIFNENLNYDYNHDRELLDFLRQGELPLVVFACEVALKQLQSSRFFLIENPEKSRLWTLQPIKDLLSLPGVWSVVLDTGAWGAEVDSQMIAKPMRFAGNVPGLDDLQGTHSRTKDVVSKDRRQHDQEESGVSRCLSSCHSPSSQTVGAAL